MAGAVLLAVTLVFVLPVAVVMSGAVAAAILGESFVADAESRHEGSDLINLNR